MDRDEAQLAALFAPSSYGGGGARALLRSLFDDVLAIAAPANFMTDRLPAPPRGRTFVVAAGKAAAAMARAVEDVWPLDAPLEGIAVTRDGHGVPCERIEVIEAAHPVPDARSRDAGARMLAQAERLVPDDLLLCLVSGGGSALMVAPAAGLDMAEKQRINRALLASGAPIGEMNVVRRHLSAIKGGRLAAAAHPARTVTLAVSDVPGDDPATIASGPTVGDPSTVADAIGILERYAIPAEREWLTESIAPDDPRLAGATFEMLATPSSVLAAFVRGLDRSAFDVVDLGAEIAGEARQVAANHATLVREIAATASRPTLVVSGGETTVTVADHATPGAGGRNTEYALALALALEDGPPVHAIACDTDGIDGSEADAGALVAPDTLARARAGGLDPRDHLGRHDSHTLFAALGDLVTTGPTRTNVNDFRAILVEPDRW